jgi:hypothetical protein
MIIRSLKDCIKKNIPSRFLEIISSKAISITRIPKSKSSVSDLFILRIENNWETYFECLHFYNLFEPKNIIKSQEVEFCFYNKRGYYIGKKNIFLKSNFKNTVNIGDLAKSLGVKGDGTFAVFHKHKELWFSESDSFPAERGYIGYFNPTIGSIKSFIHGNLDAISKNNKNYKYSLLGNYSFIKKHYYLQNLLKSEFKYELFLVNTSSVNQKITIIEKNTENNQKENFNSSKKWIFKYDKDIHSKDVNIEIHSKLYMARPVVFKLMNSSFDVFHG